MTDYGKIIKEAEATERRAYDAACNAEHYKRGGQENWDVLKAKLTREELKGFLKGTIFNYNMNARGEPKDFVKAKWYQDKLAEEFGG